MNPLKSCPFCGDSNCAASSIAEEMAVYCMNCGATGPDSESSEEEADQKWNTRPPALTVLKPPFTPESLPQSGVVIIQTKDGIVGGEVSRVHLSAIYLQTPNVRTGFFLKDIQSIAILPEGIL